MAINLLTSSCLDTVNVLFSSNFSALPGFTAERLSTIDPRPNLFWILTNVPLSSE
jgi:hypothetical protein